MILTKDEAQQRIEGILRAAGVKVTMSGYGDDGGWLEATFPDGATFDGDGIFIEVDGLDRGR